MPSKQSVRLDELLAERRLEMSGFLVDEMIEEAAGQTRVKPSVVIMSISLHSNDVALETQLILSGKRLWAASIVIAFLVVAIFAPEYLEVLRAIIVGN